MFKIIKYGLQGKSAVENPEEFISENSFAFIEGFFITSLISLGLISVLLFLTSAYYKSTGFLIFALLFLLSFFFDLWLFLKIKKFFKNILQQILAQSKKIYDI